MITRRWKYLEEQCWDNGDRRDVFVSVFERKIEFFPCFGRQMREYGQVKMIDQSDATKFKICDGSFLSLSEKGLVVKVNERKLKWLLNSLHVTKSYCNLFIIIITWDASLQFFWLIASRKWLNQKQLTKGWSRSSWRMVAERRRIWENRVPAYPPCN